ncbi:MAG: hypothetical protein R3E90_06175 [Marinicella sp.]
MDEQDMGTHSEQGKLTKSISAEKQVEASIKQYPALNKGEILLTCRWVLGTHYFRRIKKTGTKTQ